MVVSIGDFLLKAKNYQEQYRELKTHKEIACVLPIDLSKIEKEKIEGKDIESLKEILYKEARMGCDFYFKALDKLVEYENNLNEEEKDFVIYAGQKLSCDDIDYFTLQAEISKEIEITKDNIESLVNDIAELGYQSFRYHEALNFVGTEETFVKMFDDFYKDFAFKEVRLDSNNE